MEYLKDIKDCEPKVMTSEQEIWIDHLRLLRDTQKSSSMLNKTVNNLASQLNNTIFALNSLGKKLINRLYGHHNKWMLQKHK